MNLDQRPASPRRGRANAIREFNDGTFHITLGAAKRFGTIVVSGIVSGGPGNVARQFTMLSDQRSVTKACAAAREQLRRALRARSLTDADVQTVMASYAGDSYSEDVGASIGILQSIAREIRYDRRTLQNYPAAVRALIGSSREASSALG